METELLKRRRRGAQFVAAQERQRTSAPQRLHQQSAQQLQQPDNHPGQSQQPSRDAFSPPFLAASGHQKMTQQQQQPQQHQWPSGLAPAEKVEEHQQYAPVLTHQLQRPQEEQQVLFGKCRFDSDEQVQLMDLQREQDLEKRQEALVEQQRQLQLQQETLVADGQQYFASQTHRGKKNLFSLTHQQQQQPRGPTHRESPQSMQQYQISARQHEEHRPVLHEPAQCLSIPGQQRQPQQFIPPLLQQQQLAADCDRQQQQLFHHRRHCLRLAHMPSLGMQEAFDSLPAVEQTRRFSSSRKQQASVSAVSSGEESSVSFEQQQQDMRSSLRWLRQEQEHGAFPSVLKTKAMPERKPLPRSEGYRPQPPVLLFAPTERPLQRISMEEPEEATQAAAETARVKAAAKAPPQQLQKRPKSRREKEEFEDPSKADVGAVLRNQKPLIRREMYRRRLFPIGFEYAAATITEAQLLLGDRPNVAEAVLFLLYLVSFILFATVNSEITLIFAVRASLQHALEQLPAVLSSSGYHTISAAAAAQPTVAAATLRTSPEMMVQLRTLRTKTDVASWLLDGLLSSTGFPRLGADLPESTTAARGLRGGRRAAAGTAAGAGATRAGGAGAGGGAGAAAGGGAGAAAGGGAGAAGGGAAGVGEAGAVGTAGARVGARTGEGEEASAGGKRTGLGEGEGGGHMICGPCVRMTVQRVKYEIVPDSPVGYHYVWPAATRRGGHGVFSYSSVAARYLVSDAELRSEPASRLAWRYTFARVSSNHAFKGRGGYAQFICASDAATAQRLLLQGQQRSRYPPFFIPNAFISDRSTASVVIDFLTVEPNALSTSYTAIIFQFDSAGSLMPVDVSTSTYLGTRQYSAGLRYGSLGVAVFMMLLHFLFEGLRLRRLSSWRRYISDWWRILGCVQVLLVFLTYIFFGITFIPQDIPEVSRLEDSNGSVIAESSLLTADIKERLNDVAASVTAAAAASQRFASAAAVATVAGCVLMLRYLQVWGGAGSKTVDWTLKKLFLPAMTCIVFFLVVLLLFVTIGNITLGIDDAAFSGYWQSLVASAAYLVGGAAGNYSAYDAVDDLPVFATLFFLPLFILFSFLFFNVLVALVLKTYDVCAGEVERSLAKQESVEEENERLQRLKRTRPERIWQSVRTFVHELFRGLSWSLLVKGADEQLLDMEADGEDIDKEAGEKPKQKKRQQKKKAEIEKTPEEIAFDEQDEMRPPEYPDWLWNAMGMQNPYAVQGGAVDWQAAAEYYQMFGAAAGAEAAREYQNLYYYSPQQYSLAYQRQATSESVPDMAKVHTVMQYAQARDEAFAWHQIACVIFLVALTFLVCMQNMLPFALDMQQSVEAALLQTTWLPPAREVLFDDLSLGLAPLVIYVAPEPRSFSSIATVEDVHAWISSPTGLTYFLFNTTEISQYTELFHANLIAFNDQNYVPFVVNNWNAMLTPRPVRLRLQVFSSISSSTQLTYPLSLGFLPSAASASDSFNYYINAIDNASTVYAALQRLGSERPFRAAVRELSISFGLYNNNVQQNQYSSCRISFIKETATQAEVTGAVKTRVDVDSIGLEPYDFTRWQRVTAVILEVLILLVFLYFIIAGVVDFYRFCRAYPSERVDTSPGLTCCVYFVDSLSNAFDVLLFFCVVAAVLAWIAFSLSPAQGVTFTNGFVSYLSGKLETQYASLDKVQSDFSSAYAAVEAYTQICAALIMLGSLRLLRQFGKKQRMAILLLTVMEAIEQLLYVFFLVFFFYVGLAFMCYFSFGQRVSGFSTVRKSFVGSFLLLLGSFPVNEIFQANLPIAAFALFPSLFFVGVICLACFLCALLRSFFARVAEVEKAEVLLQQQQGFTGERRDAGGMRRWCRQLLCMGNPKHTEGSCLKESQGSGRLAHAGGQNEEVYQYVTHRQKQLLADDEVSVDEFEEMKKIDLLARRMRQKPVKVAEIPKEVVTSQLTDEQWRMLPVQVSYWAQSEVDSFNALFRKLQMLSALAGSEKLSFVQQIEVDLYKQLTTCDKEVEQQEALLTNRLSIYKNRTVLEQEKLTNYTKYLERALEDREREVEMLRNEVNLVQIEWMICQAGKQNDFQ